MQNECDADEIRVGSRRRLIIGNTAPATPTPFTTPRRESQRLDPAGAVEPPPQDPAA